MRIARLLLVLMAGMPLAVAAFERSDGVHVQCEVERKGERRTVQEVWTGQGEKGDRHPDLGGAAAVVRQDPDGWPVIVFDRVTMRSLLASDPHMLDFIFYHECAHATDPDRGEVEANCEAFLEMERLGLMNEEKQQAIAQTHKKWRRLPTRYGGTGAIFWEKTMICVENNRKGQPSQPTVVGNPTETAPEPAAAGR